MFFFLFLQQSSSSARYGEGGEDEMQIMPNCTTAQMMEVRLAAKLENLYISLTVTVYACCNEYRRKEICVGNTGIEAELGSVYNREYHVYNLLVRPLNASFVHVQTLKSLFSIV